MVLSAFHPTVRDWFAREVGEPTEPQVRGWPAIADGKHVLIAAPTGTGKTLAAFLWALDGLLRRGEALQPATQVLYVSPLRALSNDVQKNLSGPLAQLRALDPTLPDVRVQVRTGDTTASQRASMVRKHPHVLVTTPESLYILLTSDSGRGMLRSVRTVIVDEIHALARDKRGSHLALSLERLDRLTGGCQRIGLSATQKPIEEVAHLLTGVGRPCELIDTGHRREMDIGVEVPGAPLSAVCSHEQWGAIYARMAELAAEHKTTLCFVGTRKLAERLAARLTEAIGEDLVACHHGSLSKDMRMEAEQKLKDGSLRVLVATASLELGIDIGDVDLVMQVGAARSVATLLQRIGRAGHGVHRTPKGRLFPLTLDELAEAAALLSCVREGLLDRTPAPPPALDILAQQAVAACVPEDWSADELFATLTRAWPYRDVSREDFDASLALHKGERWSMLHEDGVNGRVRATKRARIPAMTSGGAIPDVADYEVRQQPENLFIGTLNEDFAVEANVGDIFQLGNTSWQILKVEPGTVRVADAKGQPPTLPFWLGEAPARTLELSERIGDIRVQATSAEWLQREVGFGRDAAEDLAGWLAAGREALGVVPTQTCVVAERFFDETGGMQLVIHAPFGGRINRAWGLALRKTFCRGFGFELQAAATEEAILISLGPQHSFPLGDVFRFLHSKTARKTLIQALLPAPMFTTRWRWNLTRSLMLPRMRAGKKVPPALQRMRADDMMVRAFPQVMACGETLPAGDLPVPMEHPLVRQTVEDCLVEAMDIDGLLDVLRGIESGAIQTVAVDLPEPSPFAASILQAQPYAFLDDAPLEERRTQAVSSRRGLSKQDADAIGALDPDIVADVKRQAWPEPASADEVHEALLWMGYVTPDEARPWQHWIDALAADGRVQLEDGKWFAAEASRQPLDVLRGRLEALGPVFSDDPLLFELESRGEVLRTRIDGRDAFCIRRLLARIHRGTLEKLRAEIQPVSAADLLRFLTRWQHVAAGHQLEGPRGVLEVVRQLAGLQVPAARWESTILPARVHGYRKVWLDELMLSGQVAWGRLWGTGTAAIRTVPVSLVPREDMDAWRQLAGPGDAWSVQGTARAVLEQLLRRGACFGAELQKRLGVLPAQLDQALGELVGLGLVTCDGFAGLRELFAGRRAPSRRRARGRLPVAAGRWTLFRAAAAADAPADDGQLSLGLTADDDEVTVSPPELAARTLLARTGVVFRRLLERERLPVPWWQIVRVLRRMEARGEVRGGRFVAGFPGEQYALPEAVKALRQARREGAAAFGAVEVAAADPLNYIGILTPDARVATNARQRVQVA